MKDIKKGQDDFDLSLNYSPKIKEDFKTSKLPNSNEE